MTVKALTIRDPWASCIATDWPGAKRVENRGAGTTYRGRLYIHRAKTPDVKADRDPRVVRLLGPDPRLNRRPGVIVAVAELTDVHQAAAGGCCKPWGEDWYYGPTATGRAVHWVLSNVTVLDWVVPARGALGLWTPPAEVVAEVEKQLTEAAAR